MNSTYAFMLNNFPSSFVFFRRIVFAVWILLSFPAYSQQMSTCPVPGNNCNPSYNSTSVLPDTAYFNCDKTRLLDPGLDKSGKILYKWTAPDGTITNTANLLAKDGLTGYYTLCYDTANTAVPACPRTDQVYVTQYKKKFANAGPDQVICSNKETIIGTSTVNPNYTYDWKPTYFFAGDLKRPNPKLIYKNTGATTANYKAWIYVVDKLTGCKDSDDVKLQINALPLLRIDSLRSNYCTGERTLIKLYAYDPTIANQPSTKFSSSFLINNVAQTLPVPRDTLLRLKFPGIPEGSYPSKVYDYYLTPNTSGNVVLHFSLTSEAGCSSSIDSIIKVNVPSSNITVSGLNNNAQYCSDEDNLVPLTAATGSGVATAGTFTISPASSAITRDAGNRFFFNPSKAVPGTNTITYTEPKTGSGASMTCGATGSQKVEVRPLPIPKIIGRSSVCPGSTDAEYKDTAHYPGPSIVRSWQIAGGVIKKQNLNPENDSIVVDYPMTPGMATITVTNDNGCTASKDFQVTIQKSVKSQPPSGDSIFCTGFDSVLYFAEPGSKYKHQWFVNGGTLDPKYKVYSDAPSAYVKWDPGQPIYWLWVRDSSVVDNTCFGNSDTLKIKFTQDPFAKFITPDSSDVCKGLSFTLEADPQGGNIFTWTPDNLSGASVVVTPQVTTTYTLIVGKGTACPDKSAEITLLVQPLPGDPLPQPDFQICFEEITDTILVAMKDSPSNTLVWNKDPSQTDDFIRIQAAGIYTVVQTNIFGCPTEGTISVGDNCPVRLYIPEAFSPNKDGKNDTLIIFGNNHFDNFQMRIFDRWGEIMFSTTDANQSWTGEYNGTTAPSGTYPWVITYETTSETKKKERVVKKGSVSLIR
jgi:gliding motility-associated-like protein